MTPMPCVWQYGRMSASTSPVEHRVGRLQAGDRRDRPRALEVLDGEVRHANPPHLAGGFEPGEGLPRLLDVRRRPPRRHLRPVDLVEVDRLHAQAPQARVDLAQDRRARDVVADLPVAAPHEAALGEHVRPFGAAGERLRHHLLGAAEAVDGGRVNPVDAEVEGAVDGRDRVAVVLRPPAELPAAAPERPGAEADARDLQVRVAELTGEHSRLSYGQCGGSMPGTYCAKNARAASAQCRPSTTEGPKAAPPSA